MENFTERGSPSPYKKEKEHCREGKLKPGIKKKGRHRRIIDIVGY